MIHCPELAAGLPTPRLPAEILGGTGGDVLAGRARIVESDGRDVTGHYQLAAWLALSAAREAGCQAALLTDGSPTCGSQFVYDGFLSRTAQSGRRRGRPTYFRAPRHHGIFRRANPAVARLDGTEGAG
ncbi:Purine nucleoside phosphorylase [Klebsiella pneumoniae]|uniref:Purine nucleoside phosphorylase n=1 Tax=Klebsiella pneumoniae TaxID=573 RepID=A0A378C5T3_KLEPN|nr:Purine nucleoside phosphorylase [Klebsiella pneumoniae]